MKTREQYKSEYINMLETLQKMGISMPKVNKNSEWYKIGYIDSIQAEYKPFRYDSINASSIIGKLQGNEKQEYDRGFMDGILSDNPYKEINKKWNIKFGNLQ